MALFIQFSENSSKSSPFTFPSRVKSVPPHHALSFWLQPVSAHRAEKAAKSTKFTVFTVERNADSGKIRQFVSLDLRFCIKGVDAHVFFTMGMCLIVKEKGIIARGMNWLIPDSIVSDINT